ncbi:hypothetical protein B0J14DRAFT_702152 [Halenospora varia]|nr:hypothetical protein B0J14DRAFT_702152 [Halenospora varia]
MSSHFCVVLVTSSPKGEARTSSIEEVFWQKQTLQTIIAPTLLAGMRIYQVTHFTGFPSQHPSAEMHKSPRPVFTIPL